MGHSIRKPICQSYPTYYDEFKSESMYTALICLQLFSDRGTQFGKILDKKTDFWSIKLEKLIKVFKIAALTQFCNAFEHKISLLKRLLKMVLLGKHFETNNVKIR